MCEGMCGLCEEFVSVCVRVCESVCVSMCGVCEELVSVSEGVWSWSV